MQRAFIEIFPYFPVTMDHVVPKQQIYLKAFLLEVMARFGIEGIGYFRALRASGAAKSVDLILGE